jgi:hypothetical protein
MPAPSAAIKLFSEPLLGGHHFAGDPAAGQPKLDLLVLVEACSAKDPRTRFAQSANDQGLVTSAPRRRRDPKILAPSDHAVRMHADKAQGQSLT